MDVVKGKSLMDVVRLKSPMDVVQSLQVVMEQAKQSGVKSTSAKWDAQLGPVNTIYYCFFISH